MSSNSSSQSYSTFYSSSSASYTDSSGRTQTTHIQSDPSGTRVVSSDKPAGGQATYTTEDIPAGGSSRLSGGGGSASGRRIEDVSDQDQAEKDRQYEERIEDEYAKREGGA